MTSNILIKPKLGIGYHNHESEIDVREQLTGYFALEFLNRIDFIGLFSSLSAETVKQIIEVQIVPLLKKRWHSKGVLLDFTPEAKRQIAEKGCTEKWGVRNLERTVDELINAPLVKFISGNKDKESRILVTEKNGSFAFEKL